MKKKYFSKIISLILAGVSAFSLVACSGGSWGDDSPSGPSGGDESASTYNYEYHRVTDSSTHDISVKETENYFIKDGTSEYKVVYPKNADTNDLYAHAEFTKLVEEATGIRLQVVEDTGLSYSESAKYIVLGKNNAVYTDAGFNLDTTGLKNRGFYIKTKGNSLFIVGHKGLGVLNGVYALLNYMFDYDYFYTDFYTISNMIDEDIPFLEIDAKDVPDFKYNTAHYAEIYKDPNNTKRLRMVSFPDIVMPFDGSASHNSLQEVITDEVGSQHPLWYSEDKSQPCLTAHGNETEYNALVDYVVERMIINVRESELEAICFSPEDTGGWCSCSACTSFINRHNGANASTYIKFLNDVAERVVPEFPEKDLKILLSVYRGTIDSPARPLANGNWDYPTDMVLHDSLAVYFAPYYESNFYAPYDSDYNEKGRNIIESWTPLSSSFFLWFYSFYADDYTIPFDSMANMQATFQYLVDEIHVESFMYQGQYLAKSSDWTSLKLYMQSKLGWDCYYDREKLLDDFFNAMFGPGADDMREYYDRYSLYMKTIHDTTNIGGVLNINTAVSDPDTWSFRSLNEWIDCCNNALKSVEIIKYSNESLYNLYRDNILREEMMPIILISHFHDSKVSTTQLATYKDFVLSTCAKLGLYGVSSLSVGYLHKAGF